MSIYKCTHSSCEYVNFLNMEIDNSLYFSDCLNNKELCTCIFHDENSQKNNKEIFLKILKKYIQFQHDKNKIIKLKNTIFHFFEIDTTKEYNKIYLDDITFECYADFDYLKCKELTINECSFHEGGRFKRIKIDSIELRLKKVEKALVFEAGGYAKDGILQEYDGYINRVEKYTNHVDGSGEVFFVGMKFEKEANFINAMLDQVIFQNCDLKKVFFLNSKVDKTEFRNCIFPRNKIRKSFSELDNSVFERHGFLLLLFIGIIGFYILLKIGSIAILYMVPLLLLIFFTSIAVISEYLFTRIYYPFSSDDHYCTYDERTLYFKMNNINFSKDLIKDTFSSLSHLYGNLQNNFESHGDFQHGGDFFYSKRYVKLLSLKGKFKIFERSVLIFHFAVNGFGEKFIRPLAWLVIVFTVGFMLARPLTNTNNGWMPANFKATSATPYFLLKDFNGSKPLSIKNVQPLYVVELNKTQRLFGQRQNDKFYEVVTPSLQDNLENRIMYLLSRFTSIVTPVNKIWYQPDGEMGYFLSSFLSLFSWFFFGAFILALRNRIRRK